MWWLHPEFILIYPHIYAEIRRQNSPHIFPSGTPTFAGWEGGEHQEIQEEWVGVSRSLIDTLSVFGDFI